VTPEWRSAVVQGDLDALEDAIDHGIDIDALDRYGQTALMLAARAGDARTVGWLIGRGADLDHAAKFGLSATMLAVIGGHREVVRLLVAAGADVTLRGSGAPGFAGRTALELAEERSDAETARLLENGRRP
jgi:ankyrin repeat protein